MAYRFTLIINSAETQIQDPVGWDTTQLTILRDKKYKGVFYPVIADSLEFHGTAFDLIRNAYESDGVEGEVYLRLDFQCTNLSDYETLFTGRLNLTEYEEINGDICTIKCPVEPQGIEQKIRTREDVSIDLSSTESIGGVNIGTISPFELTIRGREILKQARFNTTVGQNNNTTTGLIIAVTETVTDPLPLNVDFNETEGGTTNGFGIAWSFGGVTPTHPTQQYLVGENGNYDISYNLSGTISESIDDNSDRSYTLSVAYKANASATILQTLHTGATGAVGQQDYNFNVSGTISQGAVVGDTITFYVVFANYSPAGPPNTDASNFSVSLNTDSFVTISIASTEADTEADAYLIHEALSKVSQAITDQSDALRSEYFGRTNSLPVSYGSNGCGAFLAVLNGFNIRGFPDNSLFIKLMDIFEALNAVHNIGLGVEGNVIRVEELAYFYDDEIILTLENVREIKRRPVDTISKVEVGYEKCGYEEGTTRVNTQDAFCTKLEFNTGIEGTGAAYTVLSPYITDHYSVEYTRREPWTEDTTKTTKFDNDVFFIAVDPNQTDQSERDDAYTSITGIFSPETAMNLRLSPKRNLLRHSNIINGSIAKANGKIRFLKADLNPNMETEFASDPCPGSYNNSNLLEGADLNFSDANNLDGVPLFFPEMLEITTPFSFGQWLFLQEESNGKRNIYKTIKIIGVNTYLGFIEELRYNPEEGEAMITLRRKYE